MWNQIFLHLLSIIHYMVFKGKEIQNNEGNLIEFYIVYTSRREALNYQG